MSREDKLLPEHLKVGIQQDPFKRWKFTEPENVQEFCLGTSGIDDESNIICENAQDFLSTRCPRILVADEIVEIDAASSDNVGASYRIIANELDMHWFPLEGVE